jgi:hypothetical protein
MFHVSISNISQHLLLLTPASSMLSTYATGQHSDVHAFAFAQHCYNSQLMKQENKRGDLLDTE